MSHLKIMEYFPLRVADSIRGVSLERVEEIRLRIGQLIEIRTAFQDLFLPCVGEEPMITLADCQEFLENICFHSVYAWENQLRLGYITLPGGFRVGLGGKVLIENGRIIRIDTPLFFCIRVAREHIGCARSVMHYLVDSSGFPLSTLIISPPGCGKTTLLRDIAREFSCGCSEEILPRCVCVIDERSELAGCWNGIPQLDLGPRCDILDNCPKPDGILLALRALSPNVIICDELGTEADGAAIAKALSAGCAVFTTLHGDTLAAFSARFPKYSNNLFSRYLVLSRRNGPGTLEGIYDKAGRIISEVC